MPDGPDRIHDCVSVRSRVLGVFLGLVLAGAATAGIGLAVSTARAEEAPEVTVFKSPYCGCCAGWVAYMRKHGFKVKVKNVEDLDPTKKLFGVPDRLASCHTAITSGYVIEGHVPVASVRKLLSERPKAAGIAVPGMPSGVAGMGGPRVGPVKVLIFNRNGSAKLFDTQ